MKNTFRILFAAFLALTMCVCGFALTLDVAEAATEEAVLPEAALAGEAFTAVPGLNFFTGTVGPFTFDNADAAATLIAGMARDGLSSVQLADAPATVDPNGKYGKVMHLVRPKGGDWFHIKYNGYSTDGARPIYYSMNVHFGFEGTPISAWSAFVYAEKNSSGGDVHYHMSSPVNTWLTDSFKKTPKKGWKVDLQVSMSDKGQGKASTYPVNVYVDNMMLMPYYKVTYMNAEGTEAVATEYVLFDANGDVLKEFTPDNSKVSGATGYALTPGGSRVGKVKLTNQDIVLYPLTTSEVTFYNDGVNVSVPATGAAVVPTPELLGMNLENFQCWTDGKNMYFPGNTVEDLSAYAGMTLSAVCVEPVFDEKFGDLAVLFDFEGKMTPSYVNPMYDSNNNFTRTFGGSNGIKSVTSVTLADGNTAASANTTDTSASYRFAAASVSSSIPAKYTTRAKVKLPDGVARSNFANNLWLRVSAPDDKPYLDRFDGVSVASADFTQWQTGYSSIACPSLNVIGINWNSTGHNSSYLFDDYQVYAWPNNLIVFKVAEDSYVREYVLDGTTEYTFPTPEELGVEIENFLKWTDGTNYYNAGETVALSAVQYKTIKPYCQDKNMPAVVSMYENGELAVNCVMKFKYQEALEDDGRDVLHLHQWASSWNGSAYMNDARLHFFTDFDAAEYNIISIMMKKTSAIWADDASKQDTTYGGSATQSGLVMYNYINANHGYVGASNITSQQTPVDGKYHNIEIDMATKPNATYPWEKQGYGFCLDPNTVNYGGDTYLDYVRVYRDGIFSVTYDTNAPEGATVVTNVAADNGRGLGTGYLLKAEKPEVEGYIFLGWATSADSAETVTAIDLTGNVTVYAVWTKAEEKVAPEMTSEVEIRGGESNGIRFKSEIAPAVKAGLDEFGFLATREVLLPYADAEKTTRDYGKLTFLHKVNGANAAYYVQGIAYDKDAEIDVINRENTDGSIVYSAVVTGIPMEKKNEKMVVRPYAKFAVNGKEMIVYGDASAASLYDTALAVKNANGASYANNKAFIDSVLAE